MRINVIGDCPTAAALRGELGFAGFHVTDFQPRFVVHLEEHDGELILDSINSAFERAVFKHMRELTERHVKVQTAGGIQSEFEIRVLVPAEEDARKAVETAVVRACLDLAATGKNANEENSVLVAQAATLRAMNEDLKADLDGAAARLKIDVDLRTEHDNTIALVAAYQRFLQKAEEKNKTQEETIRHLLGQVSALSKEEMVRKKDAEDAQKALQESLELEIQRADHLFETLAAEFSKPWWRRLFR